MEIINKLKTTVIKEKKIVIALLLFAIFWGLFLRFYHLGQQSYWIDEGFSLNAVSAVLEKGFPILDSGFYYLRSILNTYIIAGFIKLFGLTPFVARFSTALFGTLFITLIYFFVNKITANKKLAIITTLFTALSYWEIAWGRQARMYIQFQFFFFAALLAFWLCLEKFSKWRITATALLTLGAILSHEFGFLLLGIYLIAYIIFFYAPVTPNQKMRKNQKTKFLQFIDNFFWVIFSCLAIFVPLAGMKAYQLFLARFFIEDYNAQNDLIAGNFLLFFYRLFTWLILLALVGIVWYVIKNKNIFPYIYIFLSFTLPLFLIIVSTDLLHLRYLVFLYPFMYLFVAMFLVLLSDWLSEKTIFKKLPNILILSVFTLIILISHGQFIFMPRTDYPLEFGSPQADFTKAYAAIKKLGWNDTTQIISPYPAMDKLYLGRSTYWYPLSLSGKPEEITNIQNSIYTGAPRLDDLSTLDKQKTTYFILDRMAMNRVDDNQFLSINENFKKVYKAKNITVFKRK